jgi:DNA-binding SARP family transcriptional activator/TolB-like protein
MIDSREREAGLTISVLGGFRLQRGGSTLTSIPRKGRALLAYLAVRDWPTVQRDALADLLWTDRGAEQAKHSLRQMLLVLRRAVGPLLGATEGTIMPDRHLVSSDLARWRLAAVSADRAELAEAASLYAGPLLDGFPTVSSEFDDWLAFARDEITGLALGSLGRLVRACWADGDRAAAVLAAERMVAIDPRREDSHRLLIEAYADAGRRADALRQYSQVVEIMRRDLDVAPSAETSALMARIRNEKAAPAMQPILPPEPRNGPPWVAVLPFRSLGPDLVADYLCQGLSDDLVCSLAALREPVVVSSNSTRGYLDSSINPREIGKTLGVRYIVLGSIRKYEDWIRISAELLHAESSMVMWARRFDVKAGLWFDAQDQIVGEIVGSLVHHVDESELRRSRTKRPEDLNAYDLKLQAQELMFQLDQQSFEQAGTFLRRAVEADPAYASAHATLADWYSLRVGQGWSAAPRTDTLALDAAARAAITSDPYHGRALASYGHNRSFLHRDYDAALGFFERAFAAAPNDAVVWKWTSTTFSYIGNGEEGARRAERALALSPQDPFVFGIYSSLCVAHYANGSYEDAVTWGMRSYQANPRYTSNSRYLIASLVAVGRLRDAEEISRSVMEIEPQFRVMPLLDRHPFKDRFQRAALAERLIQSGLRP